MFPWGPKRDHPPAPPAGPITIFALVCVAIIAAFIMTLASVLVYLLQSDWCAMAIGAAEDLKGIRPEYVVVACVQLLKLQVNALATNSWIAIGVVGAVLFVLMVIVVARGKATVHGPGGFGVDVGGNAADGARLAAGAAEGVAHQLEGQANAPRSPEAADGQAGAGPGPGPDGGAGMPPP